MVLPPQDANEQVCNGSLKDSGVGKEWTPQTWRSFPVTQAVSYPPVPSDANAGETDRAVWRRKKGLKEVVSKLETLPPLVSPLEIERLKLSLAQVAKGEAFLLQGGDCAEAFDYCTSQKIEHRLSLLLSMSLILIWGMKMPVVRIARMGGQYAKPRSKPTEIVNGQEINSFRGDNVNGFNIDDRIPDPERLMGAYFHSAATINHVRSLLSSGFASLPTSAQENVPWSLPLEHVRSPELLTSYEEIVRSLSEALEFMEVVGGVERKSGRDGVTGALESADIWMSHEALMLEYESALTRKLPLPASVRTFPDEEGYYCTSAHFIWIGDRTRDIKGAHVEFFRGLRNPIGIKVGPTSQPEELVRLLDIVDPKKEPGRVTLISRYGSELVEKCLPGHIEAVRQSGHPVVWCCDPMHGNTKSVGSVKTRAVPDILAEISASIKIHAALGSKLGGIHLELTGDIDKNGFSVTECTGGSMELAEADLDLRFESFCDPRLNFEQSLDIAFMLSSHFQAARRGRPNNKILTHLSLSRSQSLTTPLP